MLNNTKVIPARLYGVREDTGGEVEFLLLSRKSTCEWEIIVRPGKKAKAGNRIIFGDGQLIATVQEVLSGGNRLVRFEYEGVFEEVLDKVGQLPVPHYITETVQDKSRYQTVYAINDGSAAAPTAGLHFTKELLADMEKMGVHIAYLTLHVGIGTFRPVKVENIEEHRMHGEYYEVSPIAAQTINKCKSEGGRVIAVGTTSCRTLETVCDENGHVKACSGDTSIFIYPGYQFKAIDGMITNFHLPKSTLIMLVSAFAGLGNTMHAYEMAVEEKYRFYSFGDAMMIL